MERLFFDGGMGTVLHGKGLTGDPVCFNLTHGEVITEIHRQYLAAGAQVLTANTFGAYAHKYADIEVIIAAAIKHAQWAKRESGGAKGNGTQGMAPGGTLNALPGGSHPLHSVPLRSATPPYVALDMGPLGLMLEPFGDMAFEEAYEFFSQSANAGARNGADIILIETFYCLIELEAAVRAALETGLPVFATMTFNSKGFTNMGIFMTKMVEKLEEWGVAALGMNCGFGPDVYKDLLPQLLSVTRLPVLVQPNAGLPQIVGDTVVYDVTPQDFACVMAEMDVMAKGNIYLGGCCGTTPAHIEAMIAACGIRG